MSTPTDDDSIPDWTPEFEELLRVSVQALPDTFTTIDEDALAAFLSGQADADERRLIEAAMRKDAVFELEVRRLLAALQSVSESDWLARASETRVEDVPATVLERVHEAWDHESSLSEASFSTNEAQLGELGDVQDSRTSLSSISTTEGVTTTRVIEPPSGQAPYGTVVPIRENAWAWSFKNSRWALAGLAAAACAFLLVKTFQESNRPRVATLQVVQTLDPRSFSEGELGEDGRVAGVEDSTFADVRLAVFTELRARIHRSDGREQFQSATGGTRVPGGVRFDILLQDTVGRLRKHYSAAIPFGAEEAQLWAVSLNNEGPWTLSSIAIKAGRQKISWEAPSDGRGAVLITYRNLAGYHVTQADSLGTW